jgi:hypothetical protein
MCVRSWLPEVVIPKDPRFGVRVLIDLILKGRRPDLEVVAIFVVKEQVYRDAQVPAITDRKRLKWGS